MRASAKRVCACQIDACVFMARGVFSANGLRQGLRVVERVAPACVCFALLVSCVCAVGELLVARCAHVWELARRTGCMTGFARFQIRSWLCLHSVAYTLRVPPRPRVKPLHKGHNSTCLLLSSVLSVLSSTTENSSSCGARECCRGSRKELKRHQHCACQDADEDGWHALCVFGARVCARGTQIQFTG